MSNQLALIPIKAKNKQNNVPRRRKNKTKAAVKGSSRPQLMPLVAPTLNEAELMFRGLTLKRPNNRRMPQMHPWMHCRLNPFTSGNRIPKPDGRGSNFIVVDHWVADAITCTSTNGFVIQTLPGCLPFSALITGAATSGTDITVNGVVYTNNASLATGMLPIGVPKEWAAPYSSVGTSWKISSTSTNDPYFSSKARVTSVGRRLRYISTLTSASGQVAISASPFAISDAFVKTDVSSTAAAKQTSLTYTGFDNATPTVFAPAGSQVRSLDFAFGAPNNFGRDTIMARPEQGISWTSKQAGDVHDFHPTPDYGFGVTSNVSLVPDQTTGSNLASTVCDPGRSSSTATPPAVWMYDPSWIGEVVTVTGVTSGTTFMLETVVCVEYEVQQGSVFNALAQRASPHIKSVVENTQAMVNRLPVATPGMVLDPPVVEVNTMTRNPASISSLIV